MRLAVAARSILIVLVVGARAFKEDDEAEEGDEFTNEWVAEIQGGEHVARRVARDHGFSFNGLVEPFEDHYILTRDDHPAVSTQPSKHLTQKLIGEEEVRWAEQQAVFKIELRKLKNARQPYSTYPEANGVFDPNQWAEFDQANQVGGSSNGFGGISGGWWSDWRMGQSRPHGGMWSGDGSTYYGNNRPGFSNPYVDSSYGWPRPIPRPRPRPRPIPRPSSFGEMGQSQYYNPFYPPPQPYLHSYYAQQSLQPEYQWPSSSLYFHPPPPHTFPPPPAQTYYHQPPQAYPPPPLQTFPPPPAQNFYHQPPQTYPPQPLQTFSPPPAQTYYHHPSQAYPPSPPQTVAPPHPQAHPPPHPKPHPQPPPAIHSPLPPPQPSPNVKPPPVTGSQMPPPTGSPPENNGNNNQNSAPSPVTNPNVKPGQPTPQSEATSPSDAVSQGDLSNLGKFGTGQVDAKILDTFKGATPHIELLSAKTSVYKDQFTDPLWKNQWYCHDYRTVEGPVMDHNVVPVYNMGETGKGIKVAVVDDGCELHPDLMPNMMEELNFDVNSRKPGAKPFLGATHGTSCAGEIAMAPNNSLCGVGIAYDVKFAAVKKEGAGPMTVMFVEGSALAYRADVFDIYSNSWGPDDDGASMEDIGHLALLGLKTGYFQGRGGKGAIYTFAGGNGREDLDHCAADGFVNSLYALGIAGASQRGRTTFYSERCSAILATAYGGDRGEEMVATVDKGGKCMTTFTGTSAAVPIATGIIALVLGANKDLISRDIVHLTALTAEVAPLASNPDTWYKNGAGFWVSNDFGFGLFNAESMVKLAKKWKPIGERRACEVKIKLGVPDYLAVGRDVVVEFETKGCADNPKFHVESLEEVLLKSVVEYPYRGALSIYLTSPMGTKSALLENRPKDKNKKLNNWQIKSFHNWGENPSGKWKIEVKANQLQGVKAANGYVFEFTAVMIGTAEKPWYHGEGMVPRKYSAFRLPDGKTG